MDKEKKNYHYSFNANKDFNELIQRTMRKLNEESNIKISANDLFSTSIKRVCTEICFGNLEISTFLYNHKK